MWRATYWVLTTNSPANISEFCIMSHQTRLHTPHTMLYDDSSRASEGYGSWLIASKSQSIQNSATSLVPGTRRPPVVFSHQGHLRRSLATSSWPEWWLPGNAGKVFENKNCPTVILSFLPIRNTCAHASTHIHTCWLGNGQWLMGDSCRGAVIRFMKLHPGSMGTHAVIVSSLQWDVVAVAQYESLSAVLSDLF